MIYAFYFAILIIGALLPQSKISGRHYLIVVMTILLAIIGFRDISVGTDTLSYTEEYFRFAQMSFSEMWALAFTTNEPLYVIISWFPSIFSSSYTFFLLTWALFPVISLYKVFKEELDDSIEILLAMIVFFLLGLFAFYVAGIRQTAALSLTFVAAKFLKDFQWNGFRRFIHDKKIWCFLLILAVAYMIHNSSILFVLAVPCLFFRVRWWYLLLVVGLFFLKKYVQVDQIVLLSKFFFEDRFASYGTSYESSQNTSALIMQVILFLICFAVRGKLTKRNPHNNFYFNMMFLFLVFQSLSDMMAEMARVSFYFCMFGMVLVPRAFKEYSGNAKVFLYIGFVVTCLYYLFFLTDSNLPEYHSIF